MRAPSRTRWACTAAVASSGEIGACVSETPRSDRIRIAVPSHTSRDASRQSASTARSRPTGPSATSYSVESVAVGKRSRSSVRSFASSPFWSTGVGIATRRQCSGVSSSRLPIAPTVVRRLITSASRCGSMGGFVTWAKCCLK